MTSIIVYSAIPLLVVVINYISFRISRIVYLLSLPVLILVLCGVCYAMGLTVISQYPTAVGEFVYDEPMKNLLLAIGILPIGPSWILLSISCGAVSILHLGCIIRFHTALGLEYGADCRRQEAAAHQNAIDKQRVMCSSCGWTGSYKRFRKSDGCPVCASDQYRVIR